MESEEPEKKVVITLTEHAVHRVKEAIMDRDGEAALALLKEVINPQIEKQSERGHIKRAFES